MRYLPHTREDVDEMLQATGAKSLDDLFSSIPEKCRFNGELDLPQMTEWDLDQNMAYMAGKVAVPPFAKIFVGAGSYHHHIPASVFYLVSRSEFLTAYTPYQPEISQGTLQAIFEYQTLTARLLGMEVANASMYDGASALAEALLMAIRLGKGKRKTVAVSKAIHPFYRKVVETYLGPGGYLIIELPYLEDGMTDLSRLEKNGDLAAIAIQSPNFFGCMENIKDAADKAHNLGALLISCFTEPLSFGILKSPGSQGADIVCGEGQSMGIPQSFGGPGLGMFASRNKFVRNMPGRIIGKTTDLDGRPGFVLTLATREQHIRRERATSNICSNQGLCATMSAMFMASIGKTGIRAISGLNHDKAAYLKKILEKAGAKPAFSAPFFNEFVLKFPEKFKTIHEKLLEKNIVAGLPLESYYPELSDHYLFCATETAKKTDMDLLAKEVSL